MSIEEKLKELGIELKSRPTPRDESGNFITGKVGSDISAEEAYDLSRNTAINLLSAMNAYLGSLDRIVKIVKVFGMVNAEQNFIDHPKVINGCSDFFVEIFGDKGRHARSAVGMGSLPNNMAVEIEIIVEVE